MILPAINSFRTKLSPCFALDLAVMAATGDAVSCVDVGNDVIKCRLEVVQDVSLEAGSINYNYLE